MLKLQSCLLISAVALMLSAPLAHADTTYTLSATLADGDLITGTIVFVPAYGGYEGNVGTLKVTDNGVVEYTMSGDDYLIGSTGAPYTEIYVNEPLGGPTQFNALFSLDLPGIIPLPTLPASGPICSTSFSTGCGGNVSYFDVFGGSTSVVTSGTLTPPPTPEPSSLALLGTGVLGVVGIARRRFLKK